MKKKIRTFWKIMAGIVIFLMVISGGIFTVGYFYYGKIIRSAIIDFVKKESKGIYSADIGHLYINLLNGNLTIKELSLIPDTTIYRKHAGKGPLSPLLFDMKVKYFIVKDFQILEIIRQRKIDISVIQILSPEIIIYRMQTVPEQTTNDKKGDKIMSVPLPRGLKAIAIKEILFKQGKLDYFDFSRDTVFHQSIPSCTISLKNVLVDSVHQGKRRLFNSDDISITVNGLSLKAKNGLNLISFDEIGLSTRQNTFYIKNFHLVPQFNRLDYARKSGFQTDRLEILIPMLRLSRLNIRQLIFEEKFRAGLLEIDGLVVDDYRDKRIPRKPGFRPSMPQDALRKMKNNLKIDTVILKNGKATYAEQVGEEPGTIFFNNMNATLTGLTNDSVIIQAGLVSELNGTAFLMGKGKMNINVKFRFGDKKNSFSYSALLGPMDLQAVNPMLTKLLPAEITSGKIRQLLVTEVNANDDVAKGKLVLYYNDLRMTLHSQKESAWNSIKTGLINFVANDFVVSDDNPTKSGKLKTGVILFHRDKEKGIINFIWKSVLSGLKSQMGFNTREQKEIKKLQKNRK